MTEPTADRTAMATHGEPSTQEPISTKPLVSSGTRKVTAIVSGVVALVVFAVLGGLGYLMYKSYDWAAQGAVPATVRLRDMSFILLGLETLLLMVLVLIVAVLLVVLVVLIYDRVIPILEQINRTVNSAADTVHTVRGTTEFVSNRIVTPFIEASSYVTGFGRIVRGIADLVSRGRRPQEPQEPPAAE